MAKKDKIDVLKGQMCPMCRKKTLTLSETETEVPFFGKLFVFGMNCESCKFNKSDIEAAEPKEPCKCTIEIKGKEDLQIRVVKGAEAKVKIPHVGSIEPGPASQGYVTNVEGIINKIKKQIEFVKDNEDDASARKKAKNLLKKLQKVLWGNEKLKIIIEDPTGNSAIISDKAERKKL
ncbi:ZPR1 zinc finger domain-containing protein [Candidatus Woesearchaeota archaeon]|nr:ZPR1 zinc finger domain-containing protein [Candidatus Woesearchaeota archaeon]MBW2993944.1 ZPR1 zinc finger domain-containing protein [Candidatus Woesearchaeota archaeon]